MKNPALVVLRHEVRQLLRDRRALFAAVLLPALLYPLLFWSQKQIEESSQDILAAREVGLALDLRGADPAVADRARDLLAQRTPIQLVDVDAAELLAFEESEAQALDRDDAADRRRALVDAVRGPGLDAVVTARVHERVASRTAFHVYYRVKDDDAREAAERARAALGELEEELTLARREALLGVDPATGLDFVAVDVASAADASGAELGRLLPLLAVLVLLSGGSYAALAVFAGEREGGTLETLLVQPVPARAVVTGKFAAVLGAALVTLAANLASILACAVTGLGELPGLDATQRVDWMRFAAGIVYLPGCVLLCALLCLVCGRARTFREGQLTILPVMVATALPTAVTLQPGIETTPLLAAIPVMGPALALRDALRGDLVLVPTLVMVASHALWSWMLLARLGTILDAERVLTGADTEAESAQRHASSRRAMRWGFVSVLAMLVVGARLQSWDLFWGLGLTLWVMVPALALACAWRGTRRRGEPLRGAFPLRAPSAAHLLGSLACVPALLWLVVEVIVPLQLELLPLPEKSLGADVLAELLEGTSTATVLLLLALSPGIWEEVLFRGVLLSELRRDLPPARAILWQAFFFAAMHASVYRLLPTALMGVVLGAIVLRTRSLWPAIATHATYNGLHTLGSLERLPLLESAAWSWSPWLAVVGLLLLARPPRRARDREPPK